MTHFTYSQIPTPGQFQHDSSVTFAFRKDDTILTHIDWILERYQSRVRLGNEPVAPAILSHLFMTCNFWIKSYHEGNQRMKKERYPAVLALFEAAVNRLCELLQCHRGNLPYILEEIYGRDMHAHGFQVDYDSQRAHYMDKDERQVYRMRFKGGLAYQYPWWSSSAPMRLVPAESSHAYTAIRRKGENGNAEDASQDFGCFVMTLERELYMAKPLVGDAGSQEGMFHSSLTAGGVVTMAGSMLIRNGKILAIRSDSGHYKPTRMNLGLLLQALAMYGVNLKQITLYDFDGANIGMAHDFLKSKMTWDEFEKRRRDERAHRITAEEERNRRGLAPRFPHLPKRAPAVPARPGTLAPAPLLEDDSASLYQTV